MSKAILVDSVTALTANTDLTLAGNGTGVVNLDAGAKLNGVALGDSATGTIGTDVLAPNGDGSGLTGISAGAWAVTASGTFNGDASLDVNITSKVTKIILHDVVKSATSAQYIRTSSNGGTSFDMGATDYAYMYGESTSGTASEGYASSAGTSQISLAGYNLGVADRVHTEFTIFPSATTGQTVIHFRVTSSSNTNLNSVLTSGIANTKTTAIVNAVRYVPSSGTITSGNYTVLELN